MKKIDVILIARPDHSLQIYKALTEQKELSYKFITFKFFPKWLKKITHSKKMNALGPNVINSWKLSFINICKFKFKFKFAKNWDESEILDNLFIRQFNNYKIKLIHYWPEYGDKEIINYAKLNPQTRIFADIHMPHPKTVYETMREVYEQYGIKPETTQLYIMAQEQSSLIKNATDILVPSSYIVETYKKVYNDKRYHIVPYGITISPTYEKRQRRLIKDFIYAGRVCLEKGCDLLLDFFSRHPQINIHLYGNITDNQHFIFSEYKQYSNIIFHDPVPKIELQKHLAKYDVGIHLSRFDAYSLAVGEMIGAGLPVIVSTNTGNKDDVCKYGFGEVTDLNIDSIKNAISRICDLKIYNTYMNNIQTYISSNPQNYGENMINFYQQIINESNL